MTEQDIRHAQCPDNLPDIVDTRDRTTLLVRDTPLDTIPEEPTDEPSDSPLSSEEPASILDVDMQDSEEQQTAPILRHSHPGATPSEQPSVLRFQSLLCALPSPTPANEARQLSLLLLMTRLSRLQNAVKKLIGLRFLQHHR